MIEDLQYLLGIETSRYAVGDTINLRYGDLLASLVKIDEALFLFIQEKYYYTINQELKVLSVEPYIFSRPLKCLQHNNTQLILTSNCILEVKDKKLIEKLTVHEATDFYSNCNLFIQSTDKQFKLNNDTVVSEPTLILTNVYVIIALENQITVFMLIITYSINSAVHFFFTSSFK
ncbi:Hypothetical_protein [Hexamita inflata]|uniref:Hypothetical_protein n=1 Tax=Hexamita inflata TaxID=28002 RepID=A0AA86QX06_9EUKA|nr:Hypothetical protein HINF_LOCUS55264 [Hexamita inflata]